VRRSGEHEHGGAIRSRQLFLTSPDQLQATAVALQQRAQVHDEDEAARGAMVAATNLLWQAADIDQLKALHQDLEDAGRGKADGPRIGADLLLIAMHFAQLIMLIVMIVRILLALAAMLAALAPFTAGATAPEAAEAAEGAAESEVAAQVSSKTIGEVLSQGFRALRSSLMAELKRRALSTGVGAASRATLGVVESVQKPRSLGDALLHIGEDTAAGGFGGFELGAPTGWTALGIAGGIGQTAADAYVHGKDADFEDMFVNRATTRASSASWARSTCPASATSRPRAGASPTPAPRC